MNPPAILRATIALLALPAAALAVPSALPFTDTFETNQNLNNDGWYFRHYAAAGAAWYYAATSVNTVSPTGGSMAATINPAVGSEAYKQFSPVTLSAVGQSLTVSFDFRFTGTSPDANGALRVAFLNLDASIAANSMGGTSFGAGKAGYAFHTGTSGSPVAAYYDNLNPATALLNGLATASIGNNAAHTLTYTISLTATGLSLAGKIDSTTVVSHEIAGVTSFTADTLRINLPSVQNVGFYIDNVSVTSAIPEPAQASVLLGGLALAGMALRRRRA